MGSKSAPPARVTAPTPARPQTRAEVRSPRDPTSRSWVAPAPRSSPAPSEVRDEVADSRASSRPDSSTSRPTATAV